MHLRIKVQSKSLLLLSRVHLAYIFKDLYLFSWIFSQGNCIQLPGQQEIDTMLALALTADLEGFESSIRVAR